MNLTNEELDNIYIGLSMRKNLIQTGDAMKDVNQAVREKMPMRNLSTDQLRLVLATEDLMQRILQSKTY